MSPVALAYHDVVEAGHPESSGFHLPGANRYKLPVAQFQDHLAAIRQSQAASRVGVIEPPELLRFPAPVLLTFDDGGSSFYDTTAPMLEREGWRGYCFIATDYLDTPGFLASGQVRELRQRGHVIGAHSCSHPIIMTSCTQEQLLREWDFSTRKLSAIVGEPVQTASVPGGAYSVEVARAAARSGIRLLFNSEPTLRPHTVDGCLVLGRFAVTFRTSPAACAALANGNRFEYGKQQLLWGTKKLLKRFAGPQYRAIRERLLRSGL